MIRTRTAAAEDEDFLCALYAATRKDEILTWGWEEAQAVSFLEMQWRSQQHSYAMYYPDAKKLIVLFDDIPAGQLILDTAADVLRLVDISLLPDFRGKGIGTELLRRLQQKASKSKQTIKLNVRLDNPARHLYQKLGFKDEQVSEMDAGMYWDSRLYPT